MLCAPIARGEVDDDDDKYEVDFLMKGGWLESNQQPAPSSILDRDDDNRDGQGPGGGYERGRSQGRDGSRGRSSSRSPSRGSGSRGDGEGYALRDKGSRGTREWDRGRVLDHDGSGDEAGVGRGGREAVDTMGLAVGGSGTVCWMCCMHTALMCDVMDSRAAAACFHV